MRTRVLEETFRRVSVGDGSVLFVGTFSKVMFPSLRLGYLVVPSDLVDYFAAARSIATRHAPVLEQAVLADFIVHGHFGRHARRMREVYAERLSVLLESAREPSPDWWRSRASRPGCRVREVVQGWQRRTSP